MMVAHIKHNTKSFGRVAHFDVEDFETFDGLVKLRRVHVDADGYTQCGEYLGLRHKEHRWWCGRVETRAGQPELVIDWLLRAKNRTEAMRLVRIRLPRCRFYLGTDDEPHNTNL